MYTGCVTGESERVTECKSLEDAQTLARETGGIVVFRSRYASEWMAPEA